MDLSLVPMLGRERIRKILEDLKFSFDEHVRWMSRCEYLLVTKGTVDGEALNAQSHLKCSFGQWYYGENMEILRKSDEFIRLGDLHQQFHDAATNALSTLGPASLKSKLSLNDDICQRLVMSQSAFLMALNRYACDMAGGDQLYDSLTSVLNRRALIRLLRLERSRVERTGEPCALALADLDHFKRVNDSYGHEVGDTVLKMAADRIATGLRPYDLLFRYGGEEFLLCLPSTDMAEAWMISERIRKRMEHMDIDVGGDHLIRITVSFGLSFLCSGVTVEQSVKAADMALYEAKEAGRNTIRKKLPNVA